MSEAPDHSGSRSGPQPGPHDPTLPDDHFVTSMRIALERGGQLGEVRGRATIEPSMWTGAAPRPRLAILATMVDVVAGHVPDGPRTPTVDLRVQTLGLVPRAGEIELVARPDRIGRQLVIAEAELADASGRVFARASTNFMNQGVAGGLLDGGLLDGREVRGGEVESYERMVDARRLDDGSLELVPSPRLGNGHVGTVQGGVQAFLAELAAERLAGPDAVAVDLHIRYLSRVKVGPLQARARARSAGGAAELAYLRVDLTDAGDGDRRVAVAWLTMTRGEA